MKKIIIVLVLLAPAVFFAYTFKQDEILVEARYAMLACDGCYHLDVLHSSDDQYIDQMLIPQSSEINLDQWTEALSKSKQTVCLRGQPYRFNPDLGVMPAGIRFQITEQLQTRQCLREILQQQHR